MRTLRIILIVLALAAILIAVPSENTLAEVVPIPVDRQVMAPINEAYYLSDTEYQDPSLHVVIEKGRFIHPDPDGRESGTNYLVARITVADPSQLRTALCTSDGQGDTAAVNLAKRVNAVLAINGDYYTSSRPEAGKLIIRQGVRKKKITPNRMGLIDQLLVDENGDFTILRNATQEDLEGFEGTVINSFGFGPGLVVDGELIEEFDKDAVYDIGFNRPAQRMCIAQTGPLSYLCVASEGPADTGSVGLTIPQFAQLVYSLGDVRNAYGLDGGTSCNMVFHMQKINSVEGKIRPLRDIIYFASAWEDD